MIKNSFKFLKLFWSVSLVLLISGCFDGNKREVPQWSPISTGIEKMTYFVSEADQHVFWEIFKLDQEKFNFKIVNSKIPQTTLEWQSQIGANIVFNGGYFLEDFSPAGMLITDRELIGNRQFDFDKSGLIAINNNKIEIWDLTDTALDKNSLPDFALQSFPFLIKNSQPAITEDSGKKARRTILALDKNQDLYLIIVNNSLSSLFQAMNILMEMPIDFTTAINLDGGPSTGLAIKTDSYQQNISGVPVPNVLVINEKE